MAKVVTSYNNFAKAKLDHDMMGRFDLPIYNSGADVFRNMISNFKGNALFSNGFRSVYAFQDCEFIEFKFNSNQNYLCTFYANKIRFLAFDSNGTLGWVLDGSSNILEVATPYTLDQCKNLDYTQNNDVMVFTYPGLEPRKLIRTSANSFTFNTFARKDDPFPLTWASTVNITGVTKATNAVVTSAGHGYATGDRVKFASVVGMTELNGWTATVTVINANSYSIDVDTTLFTAYSSGGTTAKVLTGDYPACCLFYRGRLFYAATPLKGTKVWFSESGNYDIFTVPTTLTDSSAFAFVIADIAQKIEWLYPGDNSLIAGSFDGIVAINGGSVNSGITAETVEAKLTSAEPCNGTYPFKKDGLIFYVGRNGRNVYYFSYDLLTESFLSEDANFISYDITEGGLTKLRGKKDRNDLIFALRGDGALVSCNFKRSEKINGWHDRTTYGGTSSVAFQDIGQIADNNSNPRLFALVQRNGTFYIELQSEYVEFAVRSDFLTDDEAADNEAYHRYVAEQLRQCNYLDNSVSYQDYHTSTLTFTPTSFDSDGNPTAGTISSSIADFDPGDVQKHISYKTLTGYESGRFEITQYNATNNVTVNVLQIPTSNTYSSWYLSFSTVTGLSQFNGQTVGVVADGGYLADFVVSGGQLSFDAQLTSVVIGYRYTGIIKTFCLGFQYQAFNTQVTLKSIVRASVRTATSAGGSIGSSPYDLEAIQELGPLDLNYLPPLPLDGTKDVDYTDTTEEDKFLYIVQDLPLPFQVCSVMLEAQYASSS